MARRTSAHRTHRLRLESDAVVSLAAELVALHQAHVEGGFRLMGSSAVWRKDDGSYTARFVYRAGDPKSDFHTIAYTIRRLRVA